MSEGVIAALIGAAATVIAAVIAARAAHSSSGGRTPGHATNAPEAPKGPPDAAPTPPAPPPAQQASFATGISVAPAGVKRFEAAVRGEGQPHPDGRERLYIAVDKAAAQGFPYREGERVPVRFETNRAVYEAGVRTTPAQSIVYIASDLKMPGGGKVTLASILEAVGVQKGQRVTVEVNGRDVRLGSGTGPDHARLFPHSLPVTRAVAEPLRAAEIQAVLSRLHEADGPAAIVIGHSRRPPRVQVFTGSCTEADVAAIREMLKAHDPQYQASIVRDSTQYRQYRTATLDNPSGSTE